VCAEQTLVDAVVHAVNEDYRSMAEDFIKLGFLAPGTCARVSVLACLCTFVCVCVCMHIFQSRGRYEALIEG